MEDTENKRLLEVVEMIKWCGYKYSLPKKENECITIDYPGVEPDGTNKTSGHPVRFLSFDKDYVYLHSWMFGVEPHKIFMKEVLKFYLDNAYWF